MWKTDLKEFLAKLEEVEDKEKQDAIVSQSVFLNRLRFLAKVVFFGYLVMLANRHQVSLR